MDKKILILNTGGTFSKVYNEITGNLDIDTNNYAIKKIIKKSKISNAILDTIILKDSLHITKNDLKKLVVYIKNAVFKNIIVIHGTDTMDITAKYLAKKIKNKKIILTGAMVPYTINPIEATSNIMLSYGYLSSNLKSNIYIGMHGFVKKYNKIKKDKQKGIFKCEP